MSNLQEIKNRIIKICKLHNNIYEYNRVSYQCEYGDSTQKITEANDEIKKLIKELENCINDYVGVKEYKIFGRTVYSLKTTVKYSSKGYIDDCLKIKLYNNKSREYYCVKKLLDYDMQEIYPWGKDTYIIK